MEGNLIEEPDATETHKEALPGYIMAFGEAEQDLSCQALSN